MMCGSGLLVAVTVCGDNGACDWTSCDTLDDVSGEGGAAL